LLLLESLDARTRMPAEQDVMTSTILSSIDDAASVLPLDALAARVPDGALVALPPDNSLTPAALARALVRAGRRGLRLLGVPVSGFATDLLIGAGCVAAVESSGVSLGESGLAPRFAQALRAGRITMTDAPARRSTPCSRLPRRACPSCRSAASSAATSWRTVRTGG
jgi:hypothetical protein